MTIKNLALSTVAAAMVTTSAFAGTLTAVSQSIGAESVTSDKGYLNNADVNTSFTVSILGSISQGSVIYNFTNVELNATEIAHATTGAAVFNGANEVTSGCTRTTATQIVCDVNGTITTGDSLVLSDRSGATAGYPLDINVSAGFSGSTVSAQLTSATASELDSAPAVALLTTQTEWSAAVTTPFSSQIDASASFLSFQTDANATITVTKSAADINNNGASTIAWYIMPDQNLTTTTANPIAMRNAGQASAAGNQGNDNNYTNASTATLAAGVLEVDYTPDGTNAIPEASFTTSLTTTFGAYTSILLPSTTSLGSFGTYGYTGNIVGASYSAGTTDTIITLLNNQTTATADTVVTITDADGISCELSSADSDTGVTKPGGFTSTKYKLSTMLGDTECTSLTGTSYSIKLSLPTTPTKVFANAVVKRSDISGAFKVLPVYNNGTKN